MTKLINSVCLSGMALIFAACVPYTTVAIEEPNFTREEVIEDLKSLVSFVSSTHPNLARSADLAQLESVADDVRQLLPKKMTQREAWMALAVLNPVIGDAHTGLRRPVAALSAYQEGGSALLPAPIVFDSNGAVRIALSAANDLGVDPGDEVLSINGIDVPEIIDTLEPRMRGESSALGRLIMERYFAEYFWIAYGGYDRYVVRVQSARGIQTVELAASHDVSGDDAVFEYHALDDDVAYLSVASFDISQKVRFETFLADAFADIKNRGVEKLIIDLRENGGGAHDVSDVLMGYLTDAPFSAISGVTARITEENINRIPGAELGTVVSIPFRQVVEPPADHPLRFQGTVFALIGRLTYSQAIVFATTLQDYGIATIAGEETEGPANQTGQVQSFVLPHTGLEVLAPIYVFTRASGDTSLDGVIPDIPIADDPLNPMTAVRELLERLTCKPKRSTPNAASGSTVNSHKQRLGAADYNLCLVDR